MAQEVLKERGGVCECGLRSEIAGCLSLSISMAWLTWTLAVVRQAGLEGSAPFGLSQGTLIDSFLGEVFRLWYYGTRGIQSLVVAQWILPSRV